MGEKGWWGSCQPCLMATHTRGSPPAATLPSARMGSIGRPLGCLSPAGRSDHESRSVTRQCTIAQRSLSRTHANRMIRLTFACRSFRVSHRGPYSQTLKGPPGASRYHAAGTAGHEPHLLCGCTARVGAQPREEPQRFEANLAGRRGIGRSGGR